MGGNMKVELGIYLKADSEEEAVKKALNLLKDPHLYRVADISLLKGEPKDGECWEIWLENPFTGL